LFLAANPADELADLINSNRTAAAAATELLNNGGLACLALQYVHEFGQECDKVGKERPDEGLFGSTFAAACGVEPAIVATPLSGSLLFCQSSYVKPAVAFGLLASTSKALSIISNPNHTQFGVAIASYAGGGPYYWAAFFSNASNPNTSFVFANSGKPLPQHEGCFSGTGLPCNASPPAWRSPSLPLILFLSTCTSFAFSHLRLA
jgi:hypothetical protein